MFLPGLCLVPMRPTQAVIHLGNLRHNITALMEHTARHDPNRRRPLFCVAVKADGYGHGVCEVAETALELGAEYLGVAAVSEAEKLRAHGVRAPILLYSLTDPTEFDTIAELRLAPFVADAAYIADLDRAAAERRRVIGVHLKVDTGMGRIGCRPAEARELAAQVIACEHLRLDGVCTHFPVADTPNSSFTREQAARLSEVVSEIRTAGIDPGIVHAANSGAVIEYPETWFDMVRPGISVYGYYPSGDQDRPLELKPVMEFRSQVVFTKRVPKGTGISYGLSYHTTQDTTIATVPAGYGDGFNRLLSDRGEVLIRGTRYPIVGRVCMDQFMVDIGPEPEVQTGDAVTLFGPDRAGPSAEEIADLTGTIPYEVTCSPTARVPRVYR